MGPQRTDPVLASATAFHASEAAKRYASALFELAQDSGQLADVQRDFAAFAALAKGDANLTRLMASPSFTREDKAAALGKVADKSGANALIGKFLGTMASNGRAADILGAQAAFEELFDKQRGVQRAVARTAKPMTSAQRQRLEAILAKAVGGAAELTEEVDESLIGGIQLRIGSRLIDASIATKLDRMNTAMKGA